MRPQTIEHMFHGLTFTKSAVDIVVKIRMKLVKLKAKVEERQARVAGLRKEYGIDDAALVQLLQAARAQHDARQFTYTSNSNVRTGGGAMEERTIGAGVVNNILTENDFIESEKQQAETLELIAANLKPIPRWADNGTLLPEQEFTLSQEELKYLGF